jgi:hypothetical protein
MIGISYAGLPFNKEIVMSNEPRKPKSMYNYLLNEFKNRVGHGLMEDDEYRHFRKNEIRESILSQIPVPNFSNADSVEKFKQAVILKFATKVSKGIRKDVPKMEKGHRTALKAQQDFEKYIKDFESGNIILKENKVQDWQWMGAGFILTDDPSYQEDDRYYEDTVIITSDKKFGLFMQKVYEICSFVVDYMSKYEVIGAFANTAKNFQDKNPDNDDLLDNCYNQIVQQIRIFLERHADRTRLSLNELKKFSDPKIFLESEDEFDFEKEFDDEVEE